MLPGLWLVALATAGTASAQTSATQPNAGALTFNGGLDVPSVYFFRGMRQEGEPKLTLQPFGDLGIILSSRLRVNVGVWDSLHTGTSGTGGPTRRLHYEERFYSTLTFRAADRLSVASSYYAYSSPNDSFNTVKEIDIGVTDTGRFAPYGFLAFELSDSGQADGGFKKGTYLEFGATPRLPLFEGKLVAMLPLKIGASVRNYYELVGSTGATTDNAFGFFDVGGLVTMPLRWVPSRFGVWSAQGGAEYLALGKTTKAFNKGDAGAIVARVGISVVY